MGRKRKILLSLAGTLVVLVLAARIAVQPVIDTFKRRLVTAASGALGQDVRFGRVGLTFAPGPALSIKDLSARKEGVETLRVEEVRIKLELASLMKRRIRLRRVTLVRPEIFLVRHPDGSFNFGGRETGSPGKTVAIAMLLVSRGKLFYTDEAAGRKLEAEDLELYLQDFAYGGRPGDGALKKIYFKGDVKCAALKTEGPVLTDLKLEVTAAKGVFNIDPLSVTIAGVAGSGTFNIDLSSGVPAYKLSYASGLFKLKKLLPAFYHGGSAWKNLLGTAGFQADLSARGNSADELKSSLAGTLFVDAEDLRLPSQAGPDPFRVETALITMDPSALLRSQVRISSVSLLNPSVFLAARDESAPVQASSGPASAGPPPVIENLDVSGGNFVYEDGTGARLVEAANVDLALKNFSYGERHGDKAAVRYTFSGYIACSTLTVGGVVSTSVVMGAAAAKGVYDLYPLSLAIFKGTGSGRFKADLAVSPPAYKLDYSLHQFRMGEFLAGISHGRAGPNNIKGRAELLVDISARGKNFAELARTLTGRVSMNSQRMVLPGLDIDEVISKYVRSQNFNLLDIGAYLLAGPLGALGPALTKSYNFADVALSRGKNGEIRGLSAVWNIKNGAAVAEDAALASKKYRLAMKGGLDLVDGKFNGFTLAVLDKKGCAAYSQKIKGTFSHPQIGRITMLESLAGPVVGVVGTIVGTVEKLIPGVECEVFYSGSVPQPK